MISHEEAKKIAYESLSKIEEIRILPEHERKKLFPKLDAEGWEVSTEVLAPNKVQEEISLLLFFLEDFPLSFPIVFLGKDDHERIKFIPHVEISCLVCTFDNLAKPNPNLPGEVVVETVRKAKRIIEDGINKVNMFDFEDEFIAYWESKYSDKDTVLKDLLLLIEGPLSSGVKLIKLEKPISNMSYVIHQDEEIAIRFKDFLSDFKRKFTESEGYFLGELVKKIKPPYDFTNKEVIQLAKESSIENFEKYQAYINSHHYPKLVLFSKKIDGELRFFGWFHRKPLLERNGFRPGSLKPFQVLSTFEWGKHILRVSPEVFNDARLHKRSAGIQHENPKSMVYAIAGVGSIGSNLVHFLRSDHSAEFRLVDQDHLKVENLGRHLLGLEYVNKNKAFGIKEFLMRANPTGKISARDSSIYAIVENELEYINESDILVVCIGEENIEKWIANKLESKILKVPILFVWVEPYLIGGHCIYVTPDDNNYTALFDANGLFKFNIIDNGEYLSGNPILSQREAGCQTNFTPYSADQVLSFIGAIYPYISKIIHDGETRAKCFSWVGDRSALLRLGLNLSKFGKELDDVVLVHQNIL